MQSLSQQIHDSNIMPDEDKLSRLSCLCKWSNGQSYVGIVNRKDVNIIPLQ